MDNHPIPQDVTGFQFKLIGSMTLKQFGYVGVGVTLSVLFYYAPIAWYLKFLLVPTLAILGVSLAFLPIDGRPMDQMLWYFGSAILKPDRYIFQKIGGVLSFSELNLHPVTQAVTPTQVQKYNPEEHKKAKQLMNYLYNSSDQVVNPLDQLEDKRISGLFSQSINSQPSAQIQNMTTPSTNINNRQLPPAQTNPFNITPSVLPTAQPHVANVTPQTNTTQEDESLSAVIKSQNTSEAVKPINDQPANIQVTSIKPNIPSTFVQVVEPNHQQQQTIKNLSGMDFPNLITGIVKDSRGNVLAGVLVEVKNKEGESVRAFKTNALGQFASATQLANGTYTIVFEDPKGKHKFDKVEIEANGSVLEPFIVISVDAREELRRSLFG